jgi:hypothetical protein
MYKLLYSVVLLSAIDCGRSNPAPILTTSGKPESSDVTPELAVGIAEAFIRANGYTDYSPEDMSKLDVDMPEEMTDEDKEFSKEFFAQRRNSLRPRAYGWRRGRRNDPKGWTVGFELEKKLKNYPNTGQAVEMDEYGSDVWVEHMGFDLKSLPNKL